MHSPEIAILCFTLAMGFILAVAFHSPAKLLILADAPAVASSVGIGLNAKK